MKNLVLAVLLSGALLASACSTLKPVAATPEEVQRQLLSEQIVKPGERVRVVTTDETVHKFRVTAVDVEEGYLVGDDERIAIADIVAVESKKISVGRTTLLVGGVGIGVAAIIAIAIAPAVLLGGG